MAKHYLELARIGDEVAITLRSGADQSSYTRNIGVNDAFNLGLIMAGNRSKKGLSFETDAGVTLQIEVNPYYHAWLSMDKPGGNVVVGVERNVIDAMGESFWKLARAKGGNATFSHRVDFYRETEVDGDEATEDRSHLL